MNHHFAIPVSVDEWPESLARKAADFHLDRAEHEAEEGRDANARSHRQAADLHVRASFYFQRARRSSDDGKSAHADDHLKRGKGLILDAIDLCHREGIEAPEGLHNTLGVSRGEGTKVGGF